METEKETGTKLSRRRKKEMNEREETECRGKMVKEERERGGEGCDRRGEEGEREKINIERSQIQ